MRQAYWEALADRFEDEVFNPLRHDRKGLILSTLLAKSSKKKRVADLGCGTGRLLRQLAGYCGDVTALDISARCLRVARRQTQDCDNITFLQRDLSQPLNDLAQVDLATCLNVVMMPHYETRMRVLDNICSLIRPGGSLILLLPALESVLLTLHRLVIWNIQETANYPSAAAAATPELGFTACSLRDGIVEKGGTPTKHYLKEELELLMNGLGHEIEQLEKVEYAWDTEFDSPPDTMQAPYPWDWLLVTKAAL